MKSQVRMYWESADVVLTKLANGLFEVNKNRYGHSNIKIESVEATALIGRSKNPLVLHSKTL
ncbi:hypothetical protein [Oceanobacillus sp. FSL H7-0719]|uniref:hypothetical protein n=1 Tax=Oceanobacillus sp. FSL H7-0719 TaxID=2954507 RepID=UPI003249FE14